MTFAEWKKEEAEEEELRRKNQQSFSDDRAHRGTIIMEAPVQSNRPTHTAEVLQEFPRNMQWVAWYRTH